MDADAFTPADAAALELRVLEGPQAGARAPLAGTCVLAIAAAGARDDDADLLLRDDAGPAARLRIAAAGGHALLEVLAGEVHLGDEALGPGRVAPWPMPARLRVVGTLLALAPAGGNPAAPEDSPDAAAGDAAAAALPGPAAPRRRRLRAAWLLPLGLVAVLAGTAALGLVLVQPGAGAPPLQPPSLAEALQGSEFKTLALSKDAAGRPVLQGRLATLAQRTRLESWLAARPSGAGVQLQVQVDEALTRDVTELFRVNGVPVQARVQGPGQVEVEAAEPDAQRLARAEEAVRRDVRGLAQMDLVNKARPAPPPAPPMPDDPGKRIASLVPGDPAYLVTADGSRYFVGALLPSGHRITRIDGQRVTLERGGEASALNF